MIKKIFYLVVFLPAVCLGANNIVISGAGAGSILIQGATPAAISGGASTLGIGTGTYTNFTNNVSTPAAALSFEGMQFKVKNLTGTTAYVLIDTMSSTGLMAISSMTNYMTQSSATLNSLTLSSAAATYQPKGTYLTSVTGYGPPLAIGSGTATNFTNIISSPAFALSFLGLQHTMSIVGSTVVVVIDTMSSTGVMAISSMTNYMTQSSATLNSLTLSSATATYFNKLSVYVASMNVTGGLGITANGTAGSTPSINLPSISMSTGVTGTLPVGNGGTGVTSFNTYGILYGGATVGNTSAGTSNTVLIGNLSAPPTFSGTPTVTSLTTTGNMTAGALLTAATLTVTSSATVGSTLGVTSTFTVTGGTFSINGIPYRFPQTYGSANQVLTTDGTASPLVQNLSWATASGGGASTLAVGTGTASSFTTNITSPTAAVSFLGTQFKSIANGTTNFVSLAPGNSVIGSTNSLGISLDGGGSAIVAGSTRSITIPYGCTVSSWTVISDASGSIAVHISSSTYTNYPTLSNMSGFGNGPTLTSQQKNANSTSNWTSTVLNQGDIISFVTDSASTVKWANIILWVIKT